MLDAFLSVAYEKTAQAKKQEEFVELLKQLPNEELQKIASGGIKEAFDCDGSFVEKFKDSPLLEQAIALEQQSLQLEIAQQQKSLERRQMEKDDNLYDEMDKLRVSKKLLELELAKQQLGGGAAQPPPPPGAPVPGQGAQGAGAPGDMAPEGVQDGVAGGVGAKTASASFIRKIAAMSHEKELADMKRHPHLVPLSLAAGTTIGSAVGGALGGAKSQRGRNALVSGAVGAAGSLIGGYGGRHLRKKHLEKKVSESEEKKEAQALEQVGLAAGAAVVKMAVDWGALATGAKGIAGKALGWAAKNPQTAMAAGGAVAGGVVGAAAGGKDNRLGGALGGAVVGGGLGHAAGGIGSGLAAGKGITGSLQGYAKGIGQSVSGAAGRLAPPAVPGQMSIPGV